MTTEPCKKAIEEISLHITAIAFSKSTIHLATNFWMKLSQVHTHSIPTFGFEGNGGP